MRTACALWPRSLAAGALALAAAAPARAGETQAAEAGSDGASNAGGVSDPKAGASSAAETSANEAADAGAKRTAAEERQPRPPLPPEPPPARVPWARHIEVGGDLALVQRTASSENGADARVGYAAALGYGAHARWEIFRYLRFSGYFVSARHELTLPPDALVPGGTGFEKLGSVKTIAFGGRLAPTLPLGSRTRVWVSVGIGYDRFDYPRMSICGAGGCGPLGTRITVRERGASFAEVPLGVGMSFDVIRNWVTLELEASGAFVFGQGGTGTESAQGFASSLDESGMPIRGKTLDIRPLPQVGGSFVQTIGLSLVL